MTTQIPKGDLQNTEGIKILVDSFYDKVQADPLLEPIFNKIAQVNWEHHLPSMYQFWEALLFGTGNYSGKPYPKHAVLPVNAAHFERWLALFFKTIDELFEGPKVAEAKSRAVFIAKTFQQRMGLIDTGTGNPVTPHQPGRYR